MRPLSIELINQYGTPAVHVAVDDKSVVLEAADVDAVIEHLSMIRAQMRPEVPKEPSRQHQYVIELDPSWHTERHPLYDGAVMFLRHTGLGWTGFALPTQSLVRLHQALGQHLEECKEAQEAQALPN
jgi:hypothetical protein